MTDRKRRNGQQEKLQLRRETLRRLTALTAEELVNVAGGGGGTRAGSTTLRCHAD